MLENGKAKIRINQFVAESGLCSRREADRKIERGEVSVDGVRAVLGQTVDGTERIEVQGKLIKKEEKIVCLLVYKPVGVTSTTFKGDKDNIVDYVNYPQRLFTVGRLDKDSEGAILLTNNGNFVNALLRPETEHSKTYKVFVDKPVTAEFLNKLAQGVKIYNPVKDEYVVTRPCKTCKKGKGFEIILTQGYNRQIRRMCETLGYKVTQLIRTRFLFLNLDGLKYGQWRELDPEEMQKLHALSKPYLEKQARQKSKRQDENR